MDDKRPGRIAEKWHVVSAVSVAAALFVVLWVSGGWGRAVVFAAFLLLLSLAARSASNVWRRIAADHSSQTGTSPDK